MVLCISISYCMCNFDGKPVDLYKLQLRESWRNGLVSFLTWSFFDTYFIILYIGAALTIFIYNRWYLTFIKTQSPVFYYTCYKRMKFYVVMVSISLTLLSIDMITDMVYFSNKKMNSCVWYYLNCYVELINLFLELFPSGVIFYLIIKSMYESE